MGQGHYDQAKGYNVTAVQNPLTSFADDVAATNRALALQTGPVILVGHSWGGVVITEAGMDPKVVGLVGREDRTAGPYPRRRRSRTGRGRAAHRGNNCARVARAAGVTADQRLVVMGATGGVGGYAVQMARSRGAHVIATVRGRR